MKLKASTWWLCCVLLLMLTIFDVESQSLKCSDGEVLRMVDCPRTCQKSKDCSGEKTKKCICRGSLLRDESSGKCVQPQDCPLT
uniref:TIL domain-containing protein n=1 Tax=Panagrolaimus sp. ES5 TaxID=591445 RepID=A0AC34FCL2_9BILA